MALFFIINLYLYYMNEEINKLKISILEVQIEMQKLEKRMMERMLEIMKLTEK